MSIISPMPFCPSFEPCAKLTPVQVNTSRARIQNGGGSVPSGSSYNFLFLRTSFINDNSRYAPKKPTIGDSSSDLRMFVACTQSTPLVPDLPEISCLAIPTPMIDPISV